MRREALSLCTPHRALSRDLDLDRKLLPWRADRAVSLGRVLETSRPHQVDMNKANILSPKLSVLEITPKKKKYVRHASLESSIR